MLVKKIGEKYYGDVWSWTGPISHDAVFCKEPWSDNYYVKIRDPDTQPSMPMMATKHDGSTTPIMVYYIIDNNLYNRTFKEAFSKLLKIDASQRREIRDIT